MARYRSNQAPNTRIARPPLAALATLIAVSMGAATAAAASVAATPASVGLADQLSTTTSKKPTTTTAASSTTRAVAPSTTAPVTTSTAAASSTTASTGSPGSVTTLDPSLVQGGGSQPFPAELVAPIPFSSVAPELSLQDVYLVPGTNRDNPQFAVQFRGPFELPKDAYRVSILVGDPMGRRMRASMLARGSKPTGKLEQGDASGWQAAGPLPPPAFLAAGLVAITVPINEAPAGGALWVEAELGTDGSQVAVSPFFSLEALAGRAQGGKLASAPFGRVTAPANGPSASTAKLPPGPLLTMVNQTLMLSDTEPVPTELLGHKVTNASDKIRVAPNFNGGAVVTDYIWVDRTAGEVKLIDGISLPPQDRSSNVQGWMLDGLPAGGGAATLTFDFEKVAQALGLDLTKAVPAFGLRREFVLDDGSAVTADAVLATSGWFAANTVGQTLPTRPAQAGGSLQAGGSGLADSQKIGLIAAAAAGALVLLLLLAILVKRHRRRRGDAADVLDEMAAEVDEARRTGQLPAVVVHTGSEPAVETAAPDLVSSDLVAAEPVAPDLGGVDPASPGLVSLAGAGSILTDPAGADLGAERRGAKPAGVELVEAASQGGPRERRGRKARRRAESGSEGQRPAGEQIEAPTRPEKLDPSAVLAAMDDELARMTSRLHALDSAAPAAETGPADAGLVDAGPAETGPAAPGTGPGDAGTGGSGSGDQ